VTPAPTSCENTPVAAPGEEGNKAVNFWLYYVLFLGVVVRAFLYSVGEGTFAPLPYGLMGAFLLLSLLQPFLCSGRPRLTQVHLGVQTVIVFLMLLSHPLHDFYAMLYLCLTLTASMALPFGRDILWMGVFCVSAVSGLLFAYGVSEGPLYTPSYLGGVIFIGLYGRANRKAADARRKSEELRGKLEEANLRLRAYAEQAEETATVQERARLARELHDAVTQTVFGMTLTAEAARIALDQDPARVPPLLSRLQELARDALGETRAMVDELRPRSVAEAGLIRSLERHIALREKRDGLRVSFETAGEERGEPKLKDALFRTAQEALNNVVRHSGTREAALRLSFGRECATLTVADRGSGFDAGAERASESFGLVTMRERVEALGGRFRLTSAPGAGTEIEASVPLETAEHHEEKGK
jgi:signal transduction histidine kinase